MRAAFLTAVLGAFLLFASAASADCPNEVIREEQGAEILALPDCMALEMVSPAKKGNQIAREPTLISSDGKRVVFNSFAALDPVAPNNNGIGGDLFLATRGSANWATAGTNPPYGSGGSISGFNPVSFTPDLSHWLQFLRTPEGVYTLYREGRDHSFTQLSPPLEDLTGGSPAPSFQGASADHSHAYFRPEGNNPRSGSYLPGDPQPAGEGEDSNAYVTHLDDGGQPVLELLARDLNGKVWGANCGARLGGIEVTTGNNLNLRNGNRNQGAISADGTRVYFSTRPGQPPAGSCSEGAGNKKRIMVREETLAGPVISELFASECDRVAPVCSTTDGDDAYQGASIDQSKVYFTTTRQLTDSDLDGGEVSCSIEAAVAGCDLYLYDSAKPVGERLTQVSAGEPTNPTPGAGANLFNSIAAISADGSRVYFVAQSVLTTDPSPKGPSAVAGQPNLYTWNAETGDTAFIGTVAANDGGSGLWGSNGTWNNGAYPVPIMDPAGGPGGGDGHILLFKSNAPLTTDDTDGAFRDLFRYDAEAGTLARVSKAGPGGSDNGAFSASPGFGSPFNVPVGTDYAVLGRPISEDGETIEFTTSEKLLPADTNGVEDVYLWRKGQVYLVPGSSRAVNTPSNQPSVSLDGFTLAYHTITQALEKFDGDSALDVYVVRIDGGYTAPGPEEPCVIEEGLPGRPCQGPVETIADRTEAMTQWFYGPPDPPPRPRCPKGKVRRHGKCVKKQSAKKQRAHKQRAARNRGGVR